MLMAESEHRVKNTLAVVATVIERAREDTKSIDDFVASLRGRIQSMAGTQTLLDESRGEASALQIWFTMSCGLMRPVPTRALMDRPFTSYPTRRTHWPWCSTSLRRMPQSTARCPSPVATCLCDGCKRPILRRQCSELNGKRPEAPKLRAQLEKDMGAA